MLRCHFCYSVRRIQHFKEFSYCNDCGAILDAYRPPERRTSNRGAILLGFIMLVIFIAVLVTSLDDWLLY